MAQDKEKSSLEKTLAACDAFITYVPLRTEVPFRDYVEIPDSKIAYEIKPRAALDPNAEATAARSNAGSRKTVVLIPGRRFDASGTRHGQGGGWYDRFLSQVPREWLRIGFCFRRQFSEEVLPRESWDQVMDLICVVDEGSLVVYDTRT